MINDLGCQCFVVEVVVVFVLLKVIINTLTNATYTDHDLIRYKLFHAKMLCSGIRIYKCSTFLVRINNKDKAWQ